MNRPPNFHDFWFGLNGNQRERLAAKIGSTTGYLEKVAGGFALPSLHMAVRIARAAPRLNVESIVRTYEARQGAIA